MGPYVFESLHVGDPAGLGVDGEAVGAVAGLGGDGVRHQTVVRLVQVRGVHLHGEQLQQDTL